MRWLLRLKWVSERKSVRDERMRNASRMMMPRPPAPPMIGGWPPTYVSNALIVDAIPPIGNYLPVGRRADRSGKVGIFVTFEPQSASPRCNIVRSLGIAAVDAAACR